MEVYPNPKVDQFSETRFYRPGDSYLTINGDDLNVGAMERDIKITVQYTSCLSYVFQVAETICFRLAVLIVNSLHLPEKSSHANLRQRNLTWKVVYNLR